MSQRQRNTEREDIRDREAGDGDPSSAEGSTEILNTIRSEGDQLLESADDIIRRVMSEDSRQFLSQSRQQGGQ